LHAVPGVPDNGAVRRNLFLAGGLASAVLVALGIVLLVSGIDHLGDTRLRGTRTPVPGEREISLTAQKYVIYYEVDDELAPSGDGALAIPADLEVSIRDRDGSVLDTDAYLVSFNVSSGGRYAEAVRTVEPSEAGDYRLTARSGEGEGEPAVVLGEPVGGRLTRLLAGIAALAAGLAVALFMFIAALVSRRRARSV